MQQYIPLSIIVDSIVITKDRGTHIGKSTYNFDVLQRYNE